jgi:hypothetical protein
MRTLRRAFLAILLSTVAAGNGLAQIAENFSDWPVLKSTFPSTSSGGMTI